MLEESELKTKLLKTGIVKENEYLNNYVNYPSPKRQWASVKWFTRLSQQKY